MTLYGLILNMVGVLMLATVPPFTPGGVAVVQEPKAWLRVVYWLGWALLFIGFGLQVPGAL